MQTSAVSLPAKDSARLKTRSPSSRASACRLLTDPSRQWSVASCPSFFSASATSSSTSFLSSVRVSGAFSVPPPSSSPSSQRSYRTMTFRVPTCRDYNRLMRKSVLLLLGAVCLVSACSSAAPGEDFGMKDQAALREKTAAFVKAFNAKDVPQVLDVY